MENVLKLSRQEINNLKKDAHELKKSIDLNGGKYDPTSKNFVALCLISHMLDIAEAVDDGYEEAYRMQEPMPVPMPMVQEQPRTYSGKYAERIADELSDSRMYLGLFRQTQNRNFYILAKDELRHAETLANVWDEHSMDAEINEQRTAIVNTPHV